MVSLEQVKLLETKVSKAIDYVEKVTGENALLQGKLESYQKRIDELEVLVQQFKEDQGLIEDGILSALDRLNQFEDAIEKSLSASGGKKAEKEPAKPVPVKHKEAEKAEIEEPELTDAESTGTDLVDPLAGGAENRELDIF